MFTKIEGSLLENLKDYSDSDFYPFHMPGHKRDINNNFLSPFYRYDITEIDGFDNLHQPEGIIDAAQKRAAQLYDSEETYYLINGSTAGILSAISSVSERGGKLLIARNCHRAVYHAAFLNRMEVHYVYPRMLDEYDMAGEITAEDLQAEIEKIFSAKSNDKSDTKHSGIAGVVITSPTYDGISSDVEAIAKLVHSYGIPLIVDQAHGAHFGFHPAYPASAIVQGADLVIHSVHKTLPAPTQTAIIHKNGSLVESEKLKKYLRIYQSSSPSYVLMAGIEESLHIMKEEGYERLQQLVFWREKIEQETKDLAYIRICPLTEPGKVIISVKNTPITGQQLYDIFREKYHLQMEMASGSYVTAILSMMDREEGITRLIQAMKEIDRMLLDEAQRAEKDQRTERTQRVEKKQRIEEAQRIEETQRIERAQRTKKVQRAENVQKIEKTHRMEKAEETQKSLFLSNERPEKCMELWEAYTASYKEIDLSELKYLTTQDSNQEEESSSKLVAAEFINLYPPGIPLLVPGEVFDKELMEAILQYMENGYTVQGIGNNKIRVVALHK